MIGRGKFRRLTNVDDLLDDGIENNSDLKPRVQPTSIGITRTTVQQRLTTDPLEIQLANASIAEHIDNASPSMTRMAWVLLAWPPLILWAIFVYILITKQPPQDLARAIDAQTGKPYQPDRTIDWTMGILALIPALFWPYILLRKKKRKTKKGMEGIKSR